MITADRTARSLLAIAALLAAPVVWGENVHVRAALVSDFQTPPPGGRFHVGVVLEPEPGWHVYWRNPGEAGLATDVIVDLPSGFELGELQWPLPVAFTQPGGVAGYGYEQDVVLAAEATAPTAVPATVPVTVTASWLACKDICVFGSTELAAKLPLTGAALERSRAALSGWASSIPTVGEPGRFGLTVTGGPVPATGRSELTAWIAWPEAPGTVELFPAPDAALKVEDVRTRTRGLLTRVDLTVARLRGVRPAASVLPAVVVTTDPEGRRTGVVVSIDLE